MHKTLILLAALMSAGYFGHAASAENSANNSANNFAGAQIANGRIAPQPRPDYQATQLPDAVLYKNIFSLQENGKWGRADRLIKKLRTRP